MEITTKFALISGIYLTIILILNFNIHAQLTFIPILLISMYYGLKTRKVIQKEDSLKFVKHLEGG